MAGLVAAAVCLALAAALIGAVLHLIAAADRWQQAVADEEADDRLYYRTIAQQPAPGATRYGRLLRERERAVRA